MKGLTFIFLISFIAFGSFSSYAQYVSVSQCTGATCSYRDWADPGTGSAYTWQSKPTGGNIAPFPGAPVSANGYIDIKHDVTINNTVVNGAVTSYGYVLSTQSIEFNSTVTLTLKKNSILVVSGDLTFMNGATLKVEEGATLIVTGSLTAFNKLEVAVGGRVVVGGDLSVKNNGDISTTGSGYFYYLGSLTASQFPFANGAKVGTTTSQLQSDSFTVQGVSLYDFYRRFITPQPVELLYFRAKNVGQAVQLEWASAKEWDFSHYTLERSSNGKDFVLLHNEYVSGDSYTTKKYTYLDQQPQYGANYYRLTATDIDGSVEHKGLVLAYSGTKGDLEVIPNPAQNGQSRLRYMGATEGTWVSVLNAAGVELMRLQMDQKELALPVSALPKGLYLIKVWNQLESKQARLVIP